MSIIKPTVGRKVWYRPSIHDKSGVGAMQTAGDQPLDATVIAVWGDRCVNLLIFDIVGKLFTKSSMTLVQEGDTKPMLGSLDANGKATPGSFAEWMPYQQVQAKAQADVGTTSA